MPQLDFITYPSQLFWLFIVFFGLWAAMAYCALPPLSTIIQKRKDTISGLLQEAKDLCHQAEALDASNQERLAHTRRLCEQRIQNQIRHDYEAMKQAKAEQTRVNRQHLQDIDQMAEKIKKEMLAEGLLVVPELETILLKKVYATYTDAKGVSHAA